jgi:hypothetical protein
MQLSLSFTALINDSSWGTLATRYYLLQRLHSRSFSGYFPQFFNMASRFPNLDYSEKGGSKLYFSEILAAASEILATNWNKFILRRIEPLLSGDSVNSGRCYVAPAAYVCAVTLRNNGCVACGVLWGFAPRLHDSTDRVQQSVSAVQLRVHVWSVDQRTTEAEESPLLRFLTRKRLVKTLQRNSHCGELLPSKD